MRSIGVVHLPSGLSTTTDSEGAWKLSGGTVGVPVRSSVGECGWDGRILRLDLAQAARVQASVRDARGAVQGGFPARRLESGLHRLDLSLDATGTPTWLVVQVDGQEMVLAKGASRSLGSSTGFASRSVATDAPDRLAYLSFEGDTIAIDTVRNTIDSGLVRRLFGVTLGASFRKDPRVTLDSLVIWAVQEGRGRVRRFRVQGDVASGFTSSRVWFAETPSGDRPRGGFWVTVHGNGGGVHHRLVGKSDTARFEVQNKPNVTSSFGQGNALPLGDLVGPAAAPMTAALGVYSTYRFEVARSDETIVQYEWDLAGSGFQVGADSIQAGFSRPGPRILQVRTTDNEGNQAVTRFRIQAGTGRRKVVASVVPDTVTPGDVVEMAWGPDSATAVDTVFWNVEGTNLDTTVGKGPGHRFAYPVLGTDSLPVGSRTSRRFSVHRRTVDGRGAWRFANIEVVNDRPVVRIERSVSSTADLTVLDVIATDRGEIGTVEWSTTGASAVDITSSRQIRIPASLAATATITVRVRDDDLNDTQVTWKAAP